MPRIQQMKEIECTGACAVWGMIFSPSGYAHREISLTYQAVMSGSRVALDVS